MSQWENNNELALRSSRADLYHVIVSCKMPIDKTQKVAALYKHILYLSNILVHLFFEKNCICILLETGWIKKGWSYSRKWFWDDAFRICSRQHGLFALVTRRPYLSRETQKALFYHAKPHPHGFHCEAWRGKTKLFWSPGTIWPPCDKGE